MSVASEDTVYINLGLGDHMVPGMTFEVYSRRDGIPKQDGPDELRRYAGRAWPLLRWKQVLASVSRCRVIQDGESVSTSPKVI